MTTQELTRRMIKWFNYNNISQLLTSWKGWGPWAWNCFGRCEYFPKSNFLTTKVRSLVDFQPVFIFLFEPCFISKRSDGSKACQVKVSEKCAQIGDKVTLIRRFNSLHKENKVVYNAKPCNLSPEVKMKSFKEKVLRLTLTRTPSNRMKA